MAPSYFFRSLLEVDIGDKRSKVYDLNSAGTTYKIDPSISRGKAVSITESKDDQGRKVVTVSSVTG